MSDDTATYRFRVEGVEQQRTYLPRAPHPCERMGRGFLMCACDPGYLCPRCAGTPADPGYLYEPDPRDELADAIAAFADGLTMYDPELPR